MRLSKLEREKLRGMFGGRCAYCGETLQDSWHADHAEPIVRTDWFKHAEPRGPDHPERDTIENMRPACAPCNIDKHSMTLENWRRKLQDACNVLRRNQPTYRHALRYGLAQETGATVVFYFERLGVS